jgi:UDP-glucose 4-epimerase
MHYFVTGGAGFIGSSMVDHLLKNGHQVTAYDNFSTGRKEFLNEANTNKNFKLIVGDLLDVDLLKSSMKNIDFVFHFAANADVRFGLSHPDKDLQQNIVATFNVLESMRLNGVSKIGFSSTGSVYGESSIIPTPENAPFPIQTSLYASSKLAGEAYISSYCEGFGMQAWIFRFVSILGERYTHGHVFDFYKKLKKDPNVLNVLGNGKQRKSYLYIGDCLDAIMIALKNFNDKINIVNLGTDEYVEVNNSIDIITNSLNLKPEIIYSGGERGWVGDNPFIFLDTKKIRSTGWRPKLTIREGISKTLDYLVRNEYLFEERAN